MNIETEAISTIAKELVKTIKIMTNKLPFDRTKKGKIISYLGEKYYEVQLDNQVYKAYSPTYTYKENDIVYIRIPENNYNNLIIEYSIK